MIGVISKNWQKPVVEEFFQLFKVPWEFYDKERNYDVIIATDDRIIFPVAGPMIIFNSDPTPFDIKHGIKSCSYNNHNGVLFKHNHFEFPVYTNFAIFEAPETSCIIKYGEAQVGFISICEKQKIFRIGYDLFSEIEYLLSRGQPIDYAYIPSVEIHISMLRRWILETGVPLVEIPPVPYGHKFIVCLTHDVDFIGIREHKIDRSFIGFILRALFPHSLRNSQSRVSWKKVFRNLKALLSLPTVYAGLSRDFWFDIDRYMDIENDISSTFFFIPFRDRPGDIDMSGNLPLKYRAARYDIDNYRPLIEMILNNGHEIALHGIDAWCSTEKGTQEIQVIRKMTGTDAIGVRMHWLYFSDNSPKILEDAGFIYDSTLGYNEAVGYRSGTTQVFNLAGSSGLLEVPLHVMDTALFYPKRMGVSEEEALLMCNKFIDDTKTYGGVLVINWHSRSLSPERNWDDFYIELLRLIKAENVWFASARQAVEWFCMRRSVHFEEVTFRDNSVQIRMLENIKKGNTLPPLQVRIHFPPGAPTKKQISESQNFMDIPWNGEPLTEIAL